MEIAILAFSLADLWTQWIWPILMFVVGLGLVVFVHELGHFLMAKAVGIRVNRFALGLGPRLLGYKKGETDYCICAVPLGGYVAMLGQEDFKPDTGEQTDPRAFNNKSVGARFLVIAAGVVMNVIFAAVIFLVLGLTGKDFVAPVTGGAIQGMPAVDAEIVWADEAATQPTTRPARDRGLQPGDRILRMEGDSFILWLNGNRVPAFTDVMMTAVLADPDDTYKFTIERDVDGRKRIGTARIGVRATPDGLLAFGLRLPGSTVCDERDDELPAGPLAPGDKVLAINGRKIEHHWQIAQVEETLTGDPVTVTVDREDEQVDVRVQPTLMGKDRVLWLKDHTTLWGTIVETFSSEDEVREYDVRLADDTIRRIKKADVIQSPLQILGMIPRLKVLTVVEGSPADDVGLKPGDIIDHYGDQPTPTLEQLRDINNKVGEGDVDIVTLRGGQKRTAVIRPKKSKTGKYHIGIGPGMDLEHAVVARVIEGSAADTIGIRPGMAIEAVNDVEVRTWFDVFRELKGLGNQKVRIRAAVGKQIRTGEIPSLTRAEFNPVDYTFVVFGPDTAFEMLKVRIKQDGVFGALAWGSKETIKLVLNTYVTLRGLIRGTVSTKAISGPVGIGSAAITIARKSFVDFIYFIGLISAVIAVFNFLPLPVLDGGHAVFLAVEKIRGKPVPPKVMVIAQIVGGVLLLGLLVAVTWKDIMDLL